MIVRADLSPKGNRIEIPWSGDPVYIERAKSVPGYSFVKRGHGNQPALRFPLDTQTARLLRQAFGRSLRLSPELRAWGRETVARERYMASLALSPTAELRRLPRVLPDLYERTAARPYQRADIKFMAEGNYLNGNQTGMGKTAEVIAAVFEGGLDNGPQLVAAPVTSLLDTWAAELEEWQPHPVLTGETVKERELAVKRAVRLARRGKPFWLVINPAMVRYVRDRKSKMIHRAGKEEWPLKPRYPALFRMDWNSITIDEAHKVGIANTKTLSSRAFHDLRAIRKGLLTATPMGGKPLKLWGYLHWLEPSVYTSKWAWAERWLTIEETEYARVITKVLPGMEDEFAQSLQPHMIRRRRRDHRADLPEEEHFEVWCSMTQNQGRQYRKFEADAEIRIEEERLSATSILAEYARLKQFANAACRVEKYWKYNKATNEHEERLTVHPTEDSGKLQYLLDRLDENGIRAEEPEPEARALVGSESSRMVKMVAKWLRSQGIAAGELHGGITAKKRNQAIRDFRANRTQVLVVTTTAGGTSLNLEFINSVHILDETWDPDDQEQLWGRGDRGTREDALLVYWYRTQDTIQEYIHEVASGKQITNHNILDIRREMLGVRSTPRA